MLQNIHFCIIVFVFFKTTNQIHALAAHVKMVEFVVSVEILIYAAVQIFIQDTTVKIVFTPFISFFSTSYLFQNVSFK
jgi:hypothetical protein